MTKLKKLWLHDNPGVSGPVPLELLTLPAIKEIFLHDTGLVGTFPEETGPSEYNWSATLEVLTLPDDMSGSIPEELCGVLRDWDVMDCGVVWGVKELTCEMPVTKDFNCSKHPLLCGCSCGPCSDADADGTMNGTVAMLNETSMAMGNATQ